MMGPNCSLKERCATFGFLGEIAVVEVKKQHTVSFHVAMWTYLSDMHIEVFKNAYIF